MQGADFELSYEGITKNTRGCFTFHSNLFSNQDRGIDVVLHCEFMFHMNDVIEGQGALVNEAGEETPLKAGDFALVNPSEKHQYRNKGDQPFKMICGVPKEFE